MSDLEKLHNDGWMWTYSRTTRQILRCNVRTHEPPVVVAENVQDWLSCLACSTTRPKHIGAAIFTSGAPAPRADPAAAGRPSRGAAEQPRNLCNEPLHKTCRPGMTYSALAPDQPTGTPGEAATA